VAIAALAGQGTGAVVGVSGGGTRATTEVGATSTASRGSGSISRGSGSTRVGATDERFRANLSTVAGPPTETIVVAGDIAGCGWRADSATARLVQGIPGIVMTAGDNAYPSGTLRQFRECYGPTWGRFRDRTRPVPGNHDRVSDRGAAYFEYFGWRAGPPGRGYYTFTAGTWRVYALDTNCRAIGGCKEGSAEYRWLKADLAAHPSACVLAVWHHPRYSSGTHGSLTASRALLRLLYDAGAEIVVNGHDHVYERFAPMRPNGRRDLQFGIRMFVAGTGGAPLYGFPRGRLRNSRVRNATTHGVLRLTLRPGRYAWRFLPVPGGSFTDSGTGVCHDAPGADSG
jgi:3',5'-cyclic AMP phosphodiesterase CpdA